MRRPKATATVIRYDDRETGPNRCLCPSCIDLRSRAVTLPGLRCTADEARNGTVVRWRWRDPLDVYWRILITCHMCGHDRFAPKPSIKNPYWHGLCSDCFSKHGLKPKRHKLRGQHRNPFNALIDWDAAHLPNRALVYCPNFDACNGTSQKRVDESNKDKQPFYCNACLTRDKSTRLSTAWRAGSASGESQENLKVNKQKAGRQRAFSDEEALDAIASLGSQVSVVQLAKKLQCSRPTINNWVKSKKFDSLDNLIKARQAK